MKNLSGLYLVKKLVIRWFILTTIWFVFASRLSWTAIILGLFFSLLTLYLSYYLAGRDQVKLYYSIPNLLKFIPWYVLQVIISGLKLAVMVWMPLRLIEEKIVRVPTTFRTFDQLALFASLITLTPGTLTLSFNLRSRSMMVHCIIYRGILATKEPIEELLDLRTRLEGIYQ